MEKKLFLWIGLAIFGGLLIQTLIQLDNTAYRIEAASAIIVIAAVYSGLVLLKKRSASLFPKVMGGIAVLAIAAIFIAPLIVPAH